MLLAKVTLGVLWLGLAWWTTCDSLQRNPLDTRKISNARYIVYPGRCYDHRTGINLPRRKTTKFKHFCMRATCFSNYTMLIESCQRTTCMVPNVKYTSNYPHCCPEVICKKGNRMRYLLSNETVTSFPTRRPPKTGRKVKRRRKNKKGHSLMAHQEGVAGAAGGCEGNECGANVTNATEVP